MDSIKETLIVDNVGYDVEAQSAVSEAEFVKTHLEDLTICPHKPEKERTAYLKGVYKKIVAASKKLKKQPADETGDTPVAEA